MEYSTKLICEEMSPDLNSHYEFDVTEANAGQFFYAVAKLYKALGYVNDFTVTISSPGREDDVVVEYTEGCPILHEPEISTGKRQRGTVEVDEDDGWIEWNGGERPVDEREVVMVKFRNEAEYMEQATGFSWNHDGNWDDIVAYKVVE